MTFDPSDPISYLYESTEAAGERSNPIWSVDNSEILDQGVQNGKHYLEVSFEDVVTDFEAIRLTLYDDCSEKTTTHSINVFNLAL